MDLNELYRAIPRSRELCLSHNADGIHFKLVDRSRVKVVQIQKMIPGEELLRAGAAIEHVFFDRLRTMNAVLDRDLTNRSA
jgi:hypothetical protein